MSATSIHKWDFETFDAKSQWIFVTPSKFAQSMGLYVLELGHFYQDGHCTSVRLPEESFCLSFLAPSGAEPTIEFQDYKGKSYRFSPPYNNNMLAFMDNRSGYVQNQYGLCENYFIQIGGPLAGKFYDMFLSKNGQLFVEVDWLQKVIDAYEKLVRIYRQPSSEMGDLYAFNLLSGILTQMMLELEPVQFILANNHYVEKALVLIEKRYAEPLKLKDISDELHINSCYLSRLFLQYAGSSFSSCLVHARINHAKELLVTTKLSVEEIGVHCGFCNASHFIRLFRRQEGVTPFQFRTMRSKGRSINKTGRIEMS